MGFPAEVASSSGICRLCIPLEYSELRVATLNHKPVIRISVDPAANFAPEFLKRGHGILNPLLSVMC
jgi:hypothetical protein